MSELLLCRDKSGERLSLPVYVIEVIDAGDIAALLRAMRQKVAAADTWRAAATPRPHMHAHAATR